MAKLNKTPLTIRAKRGTEAEITSYTGYQLSGEIAYATDTEAFFVSNGTTFVPVGGGTLQSVTDAGNTTTNDINTSGAINLSSGGYIYGDSTNPYLKLNTAQGALLGYGSSYLNNGGSLLFHAGGSAKFYVGNSGSSYFTGYLGIGTTAPSTLLHLRGDSPTLRIEADGANESSIIELVQDGGITGAAIKYNGASNIEALQFNTGVSDVRMTIKRTNGNVGIGTTAPTEKLEVVGDIASQGIYVDRTHEGDGIDFPFAKFGLHYFYGDANSLFIAKPGGTSSISLSTQNGAIYANSNTGSIGLNGAETALQSTGGIANIRIVQHNAANNNYGKYLSVTNSANATGTRGRVDINGDLRIVDYSTSSAVEKTKIKNDGSAYFSGNIGIGTTAPTEKLHVAGNAKVDGTLVIDNTKISDVNGQVYLDNLTNGGDIFIRTRDDQGGVDTGILINGTNKTVSLHYNTIAKLITAVDGVAVTGNIKINGSDQSIYGPSNTENIRFYTPGNQIILSATNGIRFSSDILLDGSEKSISTNTGDKYFQFYNQPYDGFDRIIRQYEPIVKETSTEPAIISRADLEFRIDSNNDSTTSAFKITKDAGTELMRVNEAGNVGIGRTEFLGNQKFVTLGMGTFENGGTAINIIPNNAYGGIFHSQDAFYIKQQAYSNRGNVNNSATHFKLEAGTYDQGLLTLGQYVGGNFYGGHGTALNAFEANITNSRIKTSYYSNLTPHSSWANTSYHFRADVDGVSTFTIYENGSFVSGASTTSGLYFNTTADRLHISNQRVLEKSGASLFLGYNTNQLIFRTNNLERARFDVNGNLGIGTTAPNSKVHISGTAMQQLRMETAGGPSSAGDTSGRIGDMAYDNDFFYIKTANGWGRVQLDFGF